MSAPFRCVRRARVIDAVQWWKEGDHPRVAMNGHRDAEQTCKRCGHPKKAHGTIHIGMAPMQVCPGDVLIDVGTVDERLLSRADFDRLYERVPG